MNKKKSKQPIKKAYEKKPQKSVKKVETSTPKKKNKAISIISNPLIFLGVFLLVLSIIGIKIMDLKFTLVMDAGIIGILLISSLLSRFKRKKLVNIFVILILIICISGIAAVGVFFAYVVKKAPEFDPKKLVLSESTLIYDKDNNLIAELGAKKRENITYNEMSEVLIDAIVATEDSRFFQHNGVDAARFLKASVGQALGRSNAGGASTLSMQVIKNSFTSKEASGWEGIVRKFTDIYLSVFKLEKNYTKQEIIEFYANNHFLGANSYGVEQAAKTYFGKTAAQLNLAEASLIVGIFKAPTSYNPFNNPEAAQTRRATVLKLMYNHGYITKEEKDMANSIPVQSLLVSNNDESSEFQGYIDTVVKEITKKHNVNPYNTPLIIYTNMDSTKQRDMNNIFSGKTFKWKNDFIQAGVAVVDAGSGKVLAIGNGRNRTGVNGYNFATDINVQIGSTAKPVIDYAPGMEFLNWSTYTIFDDSKHYYSSGQEMRDSDRKYMGKITLRTALAQSRNIPALKAFQAVAKEIGLDKYKKFVESFGIKPESYFHEAHSIGSFNGSNPLAMASAYAVFANGGYYYEPYTVKKVIFRDTEEVVEYESQGKRVISDSTAFMITDALVSAVNNGLSAGARMNGYNIAAKTGTTNYTEAIARAKNLPSDAIPDSWLIGYDSKTVIGVWYGCEVADKDHYLSSYYAATQRGELFRAVASKMLTKGNTFTAPKSVVKVGVEIGTDPAKLASPSTPQDKITYEYFKRGTEPTEVSLKYAILNNVTNLKGDYSASDMTVSLSWSPTTSTATAEDEKTYGKLGYKIYKNNEYIAFTTDNYYTFHNVTDPVGTYKVVTSYKNFSDNASSGATYVFEFPQDNDVYSSMLKYPKNTVYSVGDTLAAYDREPSASDVRLYLNSTDVTDEATISVIITNSENTQVASISSESAQTFTITYTISHEAHIERVKRTVTIE